MKYILFIFSLFLSGVSYAQIGIGDVIKPHKNSSLHIGMDNKGLILPKAVDSTLVNSTISDPTMAGMVIYDKRDETMKLYDGTQWGDVYTSGKPIAGNFKSIGIGTRSLNKNASLEISSDNKGLILPKAIDATLVNEDVKDPTMAGMVIYDNRDDKLKLYDGDQWGEVYSTNKPISGSFKSVGIGTKDLNANASLEISSDNKGLILPKAIDSTLVNSTISDPTMAGMVIYDKRDETMKLYDGTQWGDVYTSGKPIAGNFKSIGIGTRSLNKNASLEISSDNKGLILPKAIDATLVNEDVKDSTMAGMVIYDNRDDKLKLYDGDQWGEVYSTNKPISGSFKSVGIGTKDLNANASLEISSDNKGLILPKAIDSTLVNSTISDPTMAGMVIYDKRDETMKLYDGTQWGDVYTSGKPIAGNFKSIGIGTRSLNKNASLEISSDNKGLILPKAIDATLVNEDVKDSTMAGMVIYDNRDDKLKLYDGDQWGEVYSTNKPISGSFQNIAIGTKTLNKNASLDIRADNKGIILPRATDLSAIETDSSMDGMLLYDPTAKTVVIYDASTNSWQNIQTSGSLNKNRMFAFRDETTAKQSITCLLIACSSIDAINFGSDSGAGAYDPSNMYANGIVTIKETGYYEVDFNVGFGTSTIKLDLGSSRTNINLELKESGSSSWKKIAGDSQGFTTLLGLGNWSIGGVKKVFQFKKGDQLKVGLVPNFTISLGGSEVMNDPGRTYMRITQTD